jgi:hypothetical protein
MVISNCLSDSLCDSVITKKNEIISSSSCDEREEESGIAAGTDEVAEVDPNEAIDADGAAGYWVGPSDLVGANAGAFQVDDFAGRPVACSAKIWERACDCVVGAIEIAEEAGKSGVTDVDEIGSGVVTWKETRFEADGDFTVSVVLFESELSGLELRLSVFLGLRRVLARLTLFLRSELKIRFFFGSSASASFSVTQALASAI